MYIHWVVKLWKWNPKAGEFWKKNFETPESGKLFAVQIYTV